MSGRDIVKCGLRASLQVCASRATCAKCGAERTQGTRADSNNRRLITTDLAHASYTCVLMLPLCGKLQKCGVAVKGDASSAGKLWSHDVVNLSQCTVRKLNATHAHHHRSQPQHAGKLEHPYQRQQLHVELSARVWCSKATHRLMSTAAESLLRWYVYFCVR
jgi:hypothetical protein